MLQIWLLGNATFQLSRLCALWFQTRRYFHVSLYKHMLSMRTRWRSHFGPQEHHLNKLGRGLLDDATYIRHLALFQTRRFFVHVFMFPYIKVKKAAKIRNGYHQVPHLTEATTWESEKNIINHHKQEPRGQPFPSR